MNLDSRLRKLEAVIPTETEHVIITIFGVWPGEEAQPIARYSFGGKIPPVDRLPDEDDDAFQGRALEAGKVLGTCLMFALTGEQAGRLPADLGWQ